MPGAPMTGGDAADANIALLSTPLRDLLHGQGFGADKSFGQHFLLDANITDKIVRLAGVSSGETVLEVGPGPGGLTRSLLKYGACVVAVEKDIRFAPILDALARSAEGRLTVVYGDARTLDVPLLFGDRASAVKIVANLPYNVGTALLVDWLTGPLRPQSMTLMFQKEVALRIVAASGSSAYGRLSVLAQTIAHCELAMTLPARAFTPPPKVDSALVRFETRRTVPSRATIAVLEQVTGAAFGQRRKMLRSSLKVLGGAVLCDSAQVDSKARAETIDLAGFTRLSEAAMEMDLKRLGKKSRYERSEPTLPETT